MGTGTYILTVVCVGHEAIAFHSSKLMVALILIAGVQEVGEHLSKCLDIDGVCFQLDMSRLYPELGAEDWL